MGRCSNKVKLRLKKWYVCLNMEEFNEMGQGLRCEEGPPFPKNKMSEYFHPLTCVSFARNSCIIQLAICVCTTVYVSSNTGLCCCANCISSRYVLALHYTIFRLTV